MATRKALVLVSGLFQELNSSSDKLDFAGNSTSDLSEGSNQYFTNTRARGAVSVASGNGLTYNSSTGVFGTSAIPNSQLANDDVTIGGTAIALGGTATDISGLNSVVSSQYSVHTEGQTNSITLKSGEILFEGSTANLFETSLQVTDPTADRTITFPDATGTVALTSDIVYPVTLNNSVTLTNKTLALGSNTISGTLAQFNTAVTDATLVSTTGSETLTNKSVNLANNTLSGTFAQFNTAVSNATLVSTTGTETLTNKSLTAPVLTGSSASAGSIIFKEDTDNGTNSATLKGPASTADVTITLPAETGTVLTTASSIANSNLANSTVTIGSSAVALGSSVTTLTGITSLTADAVVAKANGFRVIDPTDATKQVAFDASGVSTSTTRTLTVPNKNGSILTEVADDTSPQLGGTLDCNDQDVSFTAPGGESILFDASQAQLEFSDSATITFGNHSTTGDYSISYVNGTEFGILAMSGGTQDLVIGSFASGTTTKNLVSKRSNNAIELYFGGSKTAETVSGGFTVTGVCTATSFTGALNSSVTATTQSASDNSTKVATTAYVDNQVTAGAVNEFSDNVFRVKDNSDATKKLAFECSGISGSTTRTMTVPNTDGTISTESFATAIAVALG